MSTGEDQLTTKLDRAIPYAINKPELGFPFIRSGLCGACLCSCLSIGILRNQSRHLTSWMHTRKFPWLHMQRRCAHPVGCRWVSHVNEFPALDNQMEVGPTYVLEYSTRDAYGQNITWGANDPLNATWWHLVTERGFPCSHASHVR